MSLIKARMRYLRQGNKLMYNFYRNLVNREAKKLRRRYYTSQVERLATVDPGRWWKDVRSFLGLNSTSIPISKSTDSTAEEINDFFQSVSADMSPLQPFSDTVSDIPERFLLDVDEVQRALFQLNRRKSPGPDGIPTWILCDFADVLAFPVTHIFNSTMIEGSLPTVWRQADVVPIPKVNPPRSITSDLRPISLTPVLSKCVESFVVKWLLDSIGPKLDPDQFGNIKGRSTTHALLRMLHDWSTSSDKAQAMVRILLVDFSKAFDLIDHNRLMTKLCSLEVPTILIRWIHAFLYQRQQRVRLQENISGWLSINGGVPQGTKLGPILFLVTINDLSLALPTVKYVDDTTIYEAIPRGGVSQLQTQADSLQQWCQSNGARINTKKTSEIRIDFSKFPGECSPVVIDDREISVVSSSKLLGVMICDSLTWDENTTLICRKANQRLHFLVNLKRAGLPSLDLVRLYCSFIRPILEYSSCVWHFALTKSDTERIEKVQQRALRIIYGFDRTYESCLSESSLESLEERRLNCCKQLFDAIKCSGHVLHDLLPPERELCYSLRKSRAREPPLCHTGRSAKSFINACLKTFQRYYYT